MRLHHYLVVLVLIVGANTTVVRAAEGDVKRTVAMSQELFEGLQEAQALIEAKQYADGHEFLVKLLLKEKLSQYETTQIWNLTAYAYYLQERYRDAIKAYEKVLAQREVPEAITQSTLKTLSQLYFTVEDYRMALTTVKRLMAVVTDPSAE